MYLNRDTRRTIQITAPEFKSEGVGIAGDLKLLKVADQLHTEVLCELRHTAIRQKIYR